MIQKLTSALAVVALLTSGTYSLAEGGTAKEPKPAKEVSAAKSAKEAKVVKVEVGKGFKPNEIKLEAGQPVELKVTRTTDETCAKALTIPELDIKQELKEIGTVYTVSFTPTKKGRLKFGCQMNQMAGGWLIVE